ncbi:hypothetical protein Gasu2_33530 [Galdieria sulphuraria]|nr:hypothetical protein Gasu2_33530 [Galdieria sulphuraria]
MLIYNGPRTTRNGASISVDWYDQSRGIILWTLTNPTSNAISVSFNRGQNELGVPPYFFFGDAYWGTYIVENSLAFFLTGAPSPMSGDYTSKPIPLALLFTPVGFGLAFVFTIAPKSVITVEEGGFTNDSDGEINTVAQISNIIESVYVGTFEMSASFSALSNCEFIAPCANSPAKSKVACFVTSDVPISCSSSENKERINHPKTEPANTAITKAKLR